MILIYIYVLLFVLPRKNTICIYPGKCMDVLRINIFSESHVYVHDSRDKPPGEGILVYGNNIESN